MECYAGRAGREGTHSSPDGPDGTEAPIDMAMAETARIHSLVAQARRRLRLQSALNAAVLAVIPASALAAVAVFLVRAERIEEMAGLAMLLGAAALILAAFLVGWMRHFPTPLVATRIDRASGLSDRLANACDFEAQLGRGFDGEDETRELMEAAVADAVRSAPQANVKAATPFAWPRDTRAALAFATAAAAVSALYIVPPASEPAIARIEPPAAARTAEVDLVGARFGDAEAGTVLFGEGASAVHADVLAWEPDRIRVIVPPGTTIGPSMITVRSTAGSSAPHRFDILADGARTRDPNEPLAMSEDDLGYTRDLLDELRQTAESNQDAELTQLAKEIESLLDQAERGELSKEELLERLTKAHEQYMKGDSEKMSQEAMSDLKKTGQELEKSELTKELGKALSQNDLEKAKQEMEKLAQKLEKGEVSDKQAQDAAEAMEKAAKAFEKRETDREKDAEKQSAKAEKDVRDLERKMASAKNQQEKEQLGRQLEQKKRELKRLQREREEQQASNQKRSLKRLHRNMKQASEQMRQQNQQSRRQASRTMEDMAREAGKVDQDRRKVTNQKRVASQLEDLKEAMRRAKRGGTRGPQDRFGRNKRNADFQRRAGGGKGSRTAWRPGQGQKGQGNQPGGQGNQPGGSTYGDSHDPDLLGDPTRKSGKTVDEAVSGLHGKGPSNRETILSAAQKGFASRKYQEVYARYKTIVEEVINAEKVPSGYKYYVKKYFQKIKPHSM
jgi:hypothetical protein